MTENKTQRQVAHELYTSVVNNPKSKLARALFNKKEQIDTLAFSRQLGLLNPNSNFTTAERYLRAFKAIDRPTRLPVANQASTQIVA